MDTGDKLACFKVLTVRERETEKKKRTIEKKTTSLWNLKI